MSPRAVIIVLCLLSASPSRFAAADGAGADECGGPAVGGRCHSVARALRLKLIAIPSILLASVVGVCLPLFSRSVVPALRPDGNLFTVVKAFASGVILGTGYMHVLPDSFSDLSSPCLPRKPWAEFPFTAFVAMLAAVSTLMVDSLMLSFHGRGKAKAKRSAAAVTHHNHGGHDSPRHLDMSEGETDVEAGVAQQLCRNRVIVQVNRWILSFPCRSIDLTLTSLGTACRSWRWASWCTRW
jgi:solute carrier family 39 (zinc transporter), member 1/2/3